VNIVAQLAFIDARLRQHASVPGTDDEVSQRIIFTETMDAIISNIIDYESGIDETKCYHNTEEIRSGECHRANHGIDSLNLIAGLWSDHNDYMEIFP
jgi:hypothetical protein